MRRSGKKALVSGPGIKGVMHPDLDFAVYLSFNANQLYLETWGELVL
jgi:hypothetical protein